MDRAVLGPIALIAFLALALGGCGDGDADLTRADVEQIVRAEMSAAPASADSSSPLPPAEVKDAVGRAEVEEIVRAEMAAQSQAESTTGMVPADVEGIVNDAIKEMPQPEPGLTRADVEEIVGAAVAAISQPQPGITAEEARRIARAAVASIPPKSAPADYTRFFVENAIARYETEGLEATLAHYNREESVDGQWYVFIIDPNDMVIGHPDAHRLGLDLKGWVGTDANGYNFGPDMLSATEEGKWVSYVYLNPESGGIGAAHTGALEYKHVWAVRHDGLLFASGWHVSADEYTKFVVDEAIARYHAAGLESALDYYNRAGSVDGQWYVFVADGSGSIVGHHDPGWLGRSLDDLLGDAEGFAATGDGAWVNGRDVNPATGEVEDKHFWVVEHDGLVFGSGWHHDEAAQP